MAVRRPHNKPFFQNGCRTVSRLLVIGAILSTFTWSWNHGVNGKFTEIRNTPPQTDLPFIGPTTSLDPLDITSLRTPFLRQIGSKNNAAAVLSSFAESAPLPPLPELPNRMDFPLPYHHNHYFNDMTTLPQQAHPAASSIVAQPTIARQLPVSFISPPSIPDVVAPSLPEQLDQENSGWKLGKDYLISKDMPASSDVRGNLGPASTVTSEVVNDWLKDR
jgi:hypothetical protein